MFDQFSKRSQQTFRFANELAKKAASDKIETEHLLMGLWHEGSGVAVNILKNLGVTTDGLYEQLAKQLGTDTISKFVSNVPFEKNSTVLPMSVQCKKVIDVAMHEAASLHSKFLGTEHILLGLLKETKGIACKVLSNFDITVDIAYSAIVALLGSGSDTENPNLNKGDSFKKSYNDKPDKNFGFDGNEEFMENTKGGKQSHLEQFGKNLTELARKGKLDPVIGREDERRRILQIFGRRTKNNPVLLGEAGCGKTAIVEGIAQDIARGNVPEMLKKKKIISIDLASMIAGTKYRGDFEARVKTVIQEVIQAGNIILYLDELHTLVGAGSGTTGGMDAANILKPELARGTVQCIGSTTLDEYRKHIEKDAALERRFQSVIVESPTVKQTIEILNGIQERYASYHKVTYTEEALRYAAILSDRYITGRQLPDKAIDVIDEAGSRIKMSVGAKPKDLLTKEREIEVLNQKKEQAVKEQNYNLAAEHRNAVKTLEVEIEELKEKWDSGKSAHGVVDKNVIADMISHMTGVPINQMTDEESEKLLNIEEDLHKRVISQEKAIQRIAEAIRCSRAGLRDPRRPIGSFLFVGPTGVGKTLLCKILAKTMFGNEDALIQIDMSEYMEKHAVSRLVGAPPGYVGYEEGGQLTEAVRRRPYSIVLLDEIEKAHPDVFNMLLQMMEEGRLTDSFGRKVNFRNTILVMTSNVGSNLITSTTGLGFKQSTQDLNYEAMCGTLKEAIEGTFKPEFINRLDDIVYFQQLSRNDVAKIIDIELINVHERLKERGLHLTLADETREFLLDKGYSDVFGARPLKRAIEKYIEIPLSKELLRGGYKNGDNIKVVVGDDKLAFVVEKVKKKRNVEM